MYWLLFLSAALITAWGVCSAQWILNPERRTIPIPDPLPEHERRLLAADGSPIELWILRSQSPKARLLLCHGYYANRYQVLDIAEGLRKRGYDAILFEMRGHGSRPGPCTLGVKESQDAAAIVRWLCRHEQKQLPIGVLGLSMGAAVMCQLAFYERRVRAVVVDSAYSRLLPVIRRAMVERYSIASYPLLWVTWLSLQITLRKRLGRMDPAVLAPQLNQPLLAIQGGEDRRVVPLLGREFYQKWTGPKERWFEQKIAHVGMFAHHPQEYCDRVTDFFNRTLK